MPAHALCPPSEPPPLQPWPALRAGAPLVRCHGRAPTAGGALRAHPWLPTQREAPPLAALPLLLRSGRRRHSQREKFSQTASCAGLLALEA
eukprot:2777636-Rhodomonas_salina.1